MNKHTLWGKIAGRMTYIPIAIAIWVLAPLLGKYLDSFYFHYSNILADSIPVLVLGVCIILMGTILATWTIVLFRVKGRGTPNPWFPPKEFVVTGPYKFSRNPMVLGALLTMIGEAVFYYSPSILGLAVLFIVVISLMIIYIEEPTLKQRFGQPYCDYLKQVPRFFPHLWK